MKVEGSSDGVYRSTTNIGGAFDLTFSARDVRDTRTGLHAHVALLVGSKVLEHDIFNTGRAEDRQRLAKKALAVLPKPLRDTDGILNDTLQEFSAFALELVRTWRSRYTGGLLKGQRREGPIQYILKPFMVPDAGTLFFGPPGGGKSYVGLLMMQSINMAISTFWAVEPATPLYVNLERSQRSMKHRLALVNHILGLPEDTALPMLNARGQTIKAVEDGIRATMKEHHCNVIFYDSISRAGLGSLKEDNVANEIIDVLNSLGTTWGAIGHTPRDDTTHEFGSVMFAAGEDIGVQVAAEVKPALIGLLLQVRKANDIPTGIKQYYAMEFDPEIGLTGFRAAKLGEFPALLAEGKKDPLSQILAYLGELGEATATQIHKDLDIHRGTVSSILNNNEAFVRTKKVGKDQYFGLLVSPT